MAVKVKSNFKTLCLFHFCSRYELIFCLEIMRTVLTSVFFLLFSFSIDFDRSISDVSTWPLFTPVSCPVGRTCAHRIAILNCAGSAIETKVFAGVWKDSEFVSRNEIFYFEKLGS